MITSLSARQTQILKVLIDEYLETAEPVGSIALEKKYSLGISPATIRNEMVNLTQSGYLKQPHTSAGRIPTPVAMKFYINQLMDERDLGITQELKAKESMEGAKDNLDHLMKEMTQSLADNTHSLAIATMDDGSVWSHGYSNIYDNPEFFNYKVCQKLFGVIEEAKMLHQLFFERLTGVTPIEVLFGEEIGWDNFETVGIVACRFSANDKNFALGVVGPFRLNYARVIPTVRYYGDLMQNLLANG